MPQTPAPSALQADHTSLAEAAEWYAALMAGDVEAPSEDLDTRQRWQQWLTQRPQNPVAWAHIEAVSRRFAPLRAAPGEAVLDGYRSLHAQGTRRRHVLRGVGALAVTGLGGWLAWQHPAVQHPIWALASDVHTDVGGLRQIALPDGSQLWLNTASAVDVAFSEQQRLLHLRSGELLVQTAAVAKRASLASQAPFWVQTRHGRMQALGTRFQVRLEPRQSRLAVYEGAVQITTAEGGSQRVAAGEQTAFDAFAIAATMPANESDQAWVRGSLVADNIPLGALATQLARYRQAHIAVAPEVAQLKVMGVYPTQEPDRALAMLAQSLPIRVHQPLPWWITLEAR